MYYFKLFHFLSYLLSSKSDVWVCPRKVTAHMGAKETFLGFLAAPEAKSFIRLSSSSSSSTWSFSSSISFRFVCLIPINGFCWFYCAAVLKLSFSDKSANKSDWVCMYGFMSMVNWEPKLLSRTLAIWFALICFASSCCLPWWNVLPGLLRIELFISDIGVTIDAYSIPPGVETEPIASELPESTFYSILPSVFLSTDSFRPSSF